MIEKIDSLLYIEDDNNTLNELLPLFKRYAKNVYFARNGEEGMTLYEVKKPNIVITDIKMPKLDGVSMVRKIKKMDTKVKVIFLTAFAEPELFQEAIELGADGYLLKPLDFDNLDNTLNKTINQFFLEDKLSKKEEEEKKLKEELELILSTADGITIIDLETNFLYANKSFLDMLGYSLDELKTHNSIELGVKEDKEKALFVLSELIKNKTYKNYRKRYYKKDGSIVHCLISAKLMPDKKRILLSVKNITNEIHQEKLLNEYLNMIDDYVITSTTDLDGVITSVSKAFCNICGYTKDELVGKKHSLIKNKENDVLIYKDLWETIISDEIWQGELRNKNKDGSFYWASIKISPIYDYFGKKRGYQSLIEDITSKKHLEEISIKDGLTNVYNRRFFNEMFPKIINGAKRKNEILNFLMIDIDFFKKYNDSYGHTKGDEVLIKITSEISKLLKRSDDYLFRLGGEEFAVVFKEKSCEESIEFSKKINKHIESLKIEHKENIPLKYVSISSGLACLNANEIISSKEFYNLADKLLYEAKANGRNQVVINS